MNCAQLLTVLVVIGMNQPDKLLVVAAADEGYAFATGVGDQEVVVGTNSTGLTNTFDYLPYFRQHPLQICS